MPKHSPLNESHRQHGAIFAEQEGWDLPVRFGDLTSEYHAVRSAAGLFDFAHRAMLQFTGPDRLPFLQGMLSNDLRPLEMFDGQLSAILTQQGKVVADVRVLCSMNSYYLDFWEALKDKLLTHLNRYLVADEVEIHDPNNEWKMLSLQGPRAGSILGAVFSAVDLPSHPHQHAMVYFQDTPVCLVRADHSGQGGFDLIVQAGQLALIAAKLNELGATWVGTQAQNILRIEAGIPRYGVDFSEDNLLLEVGLNQSVSFTKGCYLGQEVVERIRSRGHVNKRLCGLLLDGAAPANAGDKILAGNTEAGRITSSVISLALSRPIALGYVQTEFWAPETRLIVRRELGDVGATVCALPFVDPSQPSS
jgi:folate-binding protein YgfZ